VKLEHENKCFSKHVKIQRMVDKCQVTMVVSSASNDNILFFQVIFQGLILGSLPPKNDERVACEANSWHLTLKKSN
jgi:hypothetical protein